MKEIELGRVLQIARTYWSLKLSDVASGTGTSVPHISACERWTRQISPDLRKKILELLWINESELSTLTDTSWFYAEVKQNTLTNAQLIAAALLVQQILSDRFSQHRVDREED